MSLMMRFRHYVRGDEDHTATATLREELGAKTRESHKQASEAESLLILVRQKWRESADTDGLGESPFDTTLPPSLSQRRPA